jgi:hypothetical protein
VRVWLLIALFVTVGSVAAKAETTGRQSPVGDQSRIVRTFHRESAAVSAPTVVAAVRSAGLDPATLPVKIGSKYVMHAVNKRGTRFRVVLAANTGEILAIRSAAAAKQDDVNKVSGSSRAKPRPAASSAATEPTVSMGRWSPPAPASSPPMAILPKIATSRHNIATAEPAVSPAAADEHVEARVPAMLLSTLRSVGLMPATAPVKVEPTYVVQAVNQRGMTLRVLLAANSGDILAIQPTRGALRHEHHVGDALEATDSAQPLDPSTSTQSYPPSTDEPSFIAP